MIFNLLYFREYFVGAPASRSAFIRTARHFTINNYFSIVTSRRHKGYTFGQ